MSVRMAPPLPLIFLLMIHGVSSADWGVSYSPSHICALNDSSVIMSCTYTYPSGYQIMRVFLTKGAVKKGEELKDLSEDPEYSQRLQYLGDKQQNCTIRLSHVTLKDSHEYYFRFITDKPDGKWTGKPGVTLAVTDLQVESPERVTEGDSVRLTCKSSCNLTDRATFIWYRNSQPLTERRDRNNELLLQSVRREDAGRYSCAVHRHNHISPAVELNVMYPPKSVSVSISPSGEVVSGDSVTLNCSSDSNPPAEISWFKGGTFVGSGRIYNISKISSDDSGEYKCRSINEHGEKYSDAVTLNVMYPPRNSFSALQSGRFYCQAHNQHGSQRSDAVTVTGEAFINTLLYLHIIHQFGELIMMIFLFQFIMVLVSDPSEDTYTALDLKSMTSDLYDTITVSEMAQGNCKQFPSPTFFVQKQMLFSSLYEFCVSGVSSADWGVSYSPSHMCALKNSSVIMSCTYTYPTGHQIKNVFWTKGAVKEDGEYLDLSEDPEYSQRLQYLGDKQQNCTIRLSHVTLKDSHKYYFRFTTDKDKWIGKPGVTFTVTDLQVESPERVTEGDSVRLTCKSSCNLTDRATFIWYRNSQPLTERRDRNNELLLQSVRREDAGRYSCAVHGQNLISPAVELNVMYPPKSVSVSISPSGEIVSGDSVTLICSSDSNPPALNFSWFKENESSAVGSGQSFSALQSGRFYCQAHNQHGSQRSDAVTVTVHHGAGRNVIVIAAASGGLFFIIIIIIIILLIMRKRRSDKTEDLTVTQNDLYSDASQRVSVLDEPLSEPDSANDAPYASVKPKRFRGKTPESRDTEEIQYATVQHHGKKEMEREEENENQYDNIRVHQSDAAVRRSAVETVEDASVIYSSVK
ncbi:B-cell receptor CD22-like [Ctenopharyngodon idella]|uniref:B-cell receptor CD22-like n=1 Tax=Ctenopharyngodon idella TaxID=7959 RepID=UPI002230D599|nr:B-cell receptor CD22-like [Ctenopharyngodon idella]